MSQYQPGDTVLIRGVVSREGVMLAPGVEVGQGCLDIIGDLPVFDQARQPVALMLFFPDERDCERFAAKLVDDPTLDMVYVEPPNDR